MLTELRIANFRIFDDEVTVRFRPITILIGHNSSGKSSIVKFLLMLQQSLESERSQFLTTDGDKVSLGDFSSLKNALTLKDSLTFALSAKNTPETPSSLLAKYQAQSNDTDQGELVYKTEAEVSYRKEKPAGKVAYSLASELSREAVIKADREVSDDLTFKAPFPFPWRLAGQQFQFGQPSWKVDGIELSDLDKREFSDFLEAVNSTFQIQEIQNTLHKQILSLCHLAPVRVEPQRVIQVSNLPLNNVGSNGLHALPHLQRLWNEHSDEYKFIRPHIKKIIGLEETRFRNLNGQVSQAIAKNMVTGAEVLIADYGFGVSQCLPILVQGAIMQPYSSLMVEQPEAQLHPSAQLDLGSFFADLWNKQQVGAIIETHSDNILLRLRLLIAKGKLAAKEVSVAFFTIDEDNGNLPTIKNLDINEDGSMEPGLPMEFFGANIWDGLELGAYDRSEFEAFDGPEFDSPV